MAVLVALLILLVVAAVAGYTGRGVTDSRDRAFSLAPRHHTPRTTGPRTP